MAIETRVYFVQAETGEIKIGFTRRETRLAELQTGSPVELKLLVSVPGTQRLEAQLHAKFASERIRGEWFRPHPDLLELIEKAKTSTERLLPEPQRGRKASTATKTRDLGFIARVRMLMRATEGREWTGHQVKKAMCLAKNDGHLATQAVLYLFNRGELQRVAPGVYTYDGRFGYKD